MASSPAAVLSGMFKETFVVLLLSIGVWTFLNNNTTDYIAGLPTVIFIGMAISAVKMMLAGPPKETDDTRFKRIVDKYKTLAEVQRAIREAGMETCQLIVGVDFTKSNEWTGAKSYGGRCMHAAGDGPTPYAQVLDIVGRTLQPFDDDHLIPCYGFGDTTTTTTSVFSFLPNDAPCVGLASVLGRYKEISQSRGLVLSGPTSFAPLIKKAVQVVIKAQMQFHILLIIADGQVSMVKETVDAIVWASDFPLSIVMVGVGDGPWDKMKEFDDELPQRRFDNFQFVEMNVVMAKRRGEAREAAFALRVLMECPSQYQLIQRLGMLERRAAVPTIERVVTKDPPDSAELRDRLGDAYPAPVQPSAPPETGTSNSEHTIHPEFICPITQEVMRDPVVCQDGHSYERSAIEEWLRSHDTSPLTNARLPSRQLIPNHSLRSRIAATLSL